MPPTKPTFFEFADQRRHRADEERALLFAELERRHIRGRRDDAPVLVRGDVRSRRRRSATFGYSLASCVRSSVKMNPTPIDEVHALGREQHAARPRGRIASPGSMRRIVAPSSCSARCAPRYAPSLNDLSPRPPTSNTIPTLTASVDGMRPATAGRTNSNTKWAPSNAPTRIISFRMRKAVAWGAGAARPIADSFHAS